MKVNIDKTEQVDDEQRVQIANVLDLKVSRRQATREELKDFLWAHGRDWAQHLREQYAGLTGAPVSEEDIDEDDEDDDDLGDLIGEDDEDDLEDLI